MKKIRDYAWPPNFDSYIELILRDLLTKKVNIEIYDTPNKAIF